MKIEEKLLKIITKIGTNNDYGMQYTGHDAVREIISLFEHILQRLDIQIKVNDDLLLELKAQAKLIEAQADQLELSNEEIEKAFTKESYHYEIGRHYKVLKDRIFGAKWYKAELKRRRNDHT